MSDVYILGGKRTPQGSFLGSLSTLSAPDLAATALKALLAEKHCEKKNIEHITMGQVLQAGVGQAPARQVALKSGLEESTRAVTLNKVCGSGLQALLDTARMIKLDEIQLGVAGGMENMSQAPHATNMRTGTKLGNIEYTDLMIKDGLWDPYTDRHMGSCAEECVSKYNFSRQELDSFSIESFKRAQSAIEGKVFAKEIAPVTLKTRKGDVIVSDDEGPMKAKFDKIPTLRAAFEKDGKITAANASSLNDGAAVLLLSGEKYKDQAKFKVHSYAGHAQNPTWFTTAPIEAMKKNLERSNLAISDIDVFEVNEAFAVVSMAAMKEFDIPHEKLNVFGGGISLGHPIGCSGARLVITLMNALEAKNGKYGLASLCIGGGEALSIIIERL